MSSTWSEAALGDLIEIRAGKGLPKEKYVSGGTVPVMGANGLLGWTTEPLFTAPVVTIGRVGACGEVHRTTGPSWVSDNALVVTAGPRVDLRFVYYLLRALDFTPIVGGTTQPLITQTAVKLLRVAVPSRQEQSAIAEVLAALDDKIELNRLTSHTLEATARAVFKSWFLDFDPVRAKAEGRQPAYMHQSTAALFPDRFQQSDSTLVPAGWSRTALSTFASTQYGFTASAVLEPLGPRFVRITDMNKVPWIEWASVPFCECGADEHAKYALHAGDILVSRMADPGKAAIIEDEVDAVFASYLVRLLVPPAYRYFTYYFLTSPQYLAYAESVRSGSVQANMNAKVITAAELTLPPSTVADAFDQAVRPLRHRLAASLRESATLITIRDTLLPKLLSGELRVRDAERAVEQVA